MFFQHHGKRVEDDPHFPNVLTPHEKNVYYLRANSRYQHYPAEAQSTSSSFLVCSKSNVPLDKM